MWLDGLAGRLVPTGRHVVGGSGQNLLDRARSGDGNALAELLEDHTDAVRGGLAGKIPRRWRSLLSVDDVLQQTYIDAFLHIDKFKPDGAASFRTWFVSLASYNLVDAIRMLEADKRGRCHACTPLPSKGDSILALYDLLSAAGTSPSQRVARHEARGALDDAIRRLPDCYRQVVQMYDLEGQSVDEVARALKRSPGAVYMIRARAHRRLSELLGHPSKYFSRS
jgi:RNA polymerase sigma factor (sigma-70 family)